MLAGVFAELGWNCKKRRVESSSSSLLLALWSVVVIVCGRGLQSFLGLLVVVVVEQPGPWCSIIVRGSQDRGIVDSGSWV